MFLLPDAEVELNSILTFKGILFGEADFSYSATPLGDYTKTLDQSTLIPAMCQEYFEAKCRFMLSMGASAGQAWGYTGRAQTYLCFNIWWWSE